jgi:hypothetical protein
LSIIPDEKKFNIRANFLTWQPSIYNGIRYIAQGIADHSNFNGEPLVNLNEKKILIEVVKMKSENLNFIEFTIFDVDSISVIQSDTLLQFLKGSSPYKLDFRNLCDWVVECDFIEEPPKRFNLLLAPEFLKTQNEIEDLPSKVGGFKHIIRFYDAK